MKKTTAFISLVLVVALVGLAIGAGGYFGRWIDTQSTYVPVDEPIDVGTIKDSVPNSVLPGDSYKLIYEVNNANKNNSYEMLDMFQGDWQVIKQCSISVVNVIDIEELVTPATNTKSLFQRTFTVNDTVEMTKQDIQSMSKGMELISKNTVGAGPEDYSYYCMIPYTIPAGATCRIEVEVQIRNDSPTRESGEEWHFWSYLYTYRGRDEIPYWYIDEGKG